MNGNEIQSIIWGIVIVLAITALATCTTLSVQACSKANLEYNSMSDGMAACTHERVVLK